MIVEALAPNRIDLAGGTLDIYPLYLFEDDPVTVNIGITLWGRVRLSTRDDSRIEITSLDTGLQQAAESVDALELGGPLDLMARLIRFYRPSVGLDVEVESQAPKGSGLGASSSLLIAMSGALNELNGTGYDGETLIRFGADLEAQNIRIPTGKQDYYAAYYGGVNAILWGIARNVVSPLVVGEEMLSALENRLVLSFTGLSHFSGATNWDMLRNYIEGAGSTRNALAGIKETAHRMAAVLQAGDFEGFADVLNEEWTNRRGMAAGVTTPQIDAMIDAAASAGGLASKLCGAGGGGCMITYVREGTRSEVCRAIESHGARVITYRIDRTGLTVRRLGE